jgi:hypothetical protein
MRIISGLRFAAATAHICRHPTSQLIFAQIARKKWQLLPVSR